jgi:hypothetical protein
MTISNEVPVELISFDAELLDGIVNLRWSTVTETNNLGFDIEMNQGDDQWEKIGFMEGMGTTTEKSSYTFAHILSDNKSPKLSYRLKQVDFDGSFEYSNVVEVDVAPRNFELAQNYPNPFNPVTKIKFALPKNSFVNLVVYNAIGQKVSELINREMVFGYHEVEFSAAGLSSGIYYYRLESGDFVSVKKMMILK